MVPKHALGLGEASPDPGGGVTVQVLGGDLGHVGDIVVISQGLSSEGLAPEDPPPALNQIQPGSSHWNEGVLDLRMGFEPLPDRATAVAGQVVGNHIERAGRIGAVHHLEQIQVARGVARARCLGESMPIADAQRPIHPDVLESSVIIEWDLDAPPIG